MEHAGRGDGALRRGGTSLQAPRSNDATHVGRAWLLVLLCSAFTIAGCEEDSGGELGSAAASARLAPYREAFASWDRWARRVAAADAVPRAPEALRETLFAPVRRDRDLVAAWVTRADEPAVAQGHQTLRG